MSVYTGVVFNDVYTASKFAIEGFCESLAVQLLKFNVKSVSWLLTLLHEIKPSHKVIAPPGSHVSRVLSSLRLSLIEPGPVHTEFEAKMMEEVAKMEFPGADADTVRYFKDVYIPSSIDIFEAMGQTPDDIAKVG